ncbi:MAG: GNAT family N-acetyltransferase [Gordonia sp. (in: high G+C Gram-positive bacteria)]|uniref:GNAT family N-acetyltransferase n=1 Tax=Gordonia sp. (in: high G+C Gram-positive bacteria) TaxID=84139 RepID=UPI0039E3DBDD
MNVEPLTEADLRSPEFRELLRAATDYDDARLTALVDGEIGELTVIGTRDGDTVTGFAAYLPGEDTTVIEYIASDEAVRGTGIGTALVAAVAQRNPESAVLAQTDDDAIGFYRALGFLTRDAETDPRWPDRRRYDCLRLPG